MDKKDKDLYDTVMQVEREDNLRLIAQDERERQQFGDRSYLDVALEACEKFNQEFEGTFDGPEQITETSDNSTIDELKVKYNLQDDNVVLRLISLRESIKTKKQKSMSYDELILFLQSAMNYDDMQIWLMEKEFQGIKLTLNDELKKFFELKTEDDILRLYDIEQNYDQNNIDSISKTLKKRL